MAACRVQAVKPEPAGLALKLADRGDVRRLLGHLRILADDRPFLHANSKPKRRNTVPLRSVAARLAWSPEWLFGVERMFALPRHRARVLWPGDHPAHVARQRRVSWLSNPKRGVQRAWHQCCPRSKPGSSSPCQRREMTAEPWALHGKVSRREPRSPRRGFFTFRGSIVDRGVAPPRLVCPEPLHCNTANCLI